MDGDNPNIDEDIIDPLVADMPEDFNPGQARNGVIRGRIAARDEQLAGRVFNGDQVPRERLNRYQHLLRFGEGEEPDEHANMDLAPGVRRRYDQIGQHDLATLRNRNELAPPVLLGKRGELPKTLWEDYDQAAQAGAPPQRMRKLKKQIGLGARRPLVVPSNTIITQKLDNQYGSIIKKMEDMLGTRTDPKFWNGVIEQRKWEWDQWIQVCINTIKVIDGGAIELPPDPPRRIHIQGLNDPQVVVYDGLVTNFSLYLGKNIDFDIIPLIFGVLLYVEIAPGGYYANLNDHEREAQFLEKYPHLKRHKVTIEDMDEREDGSLYQRIFLTLRKFNSNTKECIFKYRARYGPYDAIYKIIGSYSKKFFPGQKDMPRDTFQGEINNWVANHWNHDTDVGIEGIMGVIPATFMATSEQNWGLIRQVRTQMTVKGIPIEGGDDRLLVIQYLKSKHALTKWFFGKKKDLEKLSKQRIQKYLNQDKAGLDKVYQFLGKA